MRQTIHFFIITLKGQYYGNFTIFEQSEATIPLFIYKVILRHQEKEINHGLKEKQLMDCSSPF